MPTDPQTTAAPLGRDILPDDPQTTCRLAPPNEYDHYHLHWIDTEYGPMVASWFPNAVEGGLWDISGHTRRADDPRIIREWRYLGVALPPEV